MITIFEQLQHLKRLGITPNIFFDIGAHKGTWSKSVKQIFPKSEFYLFEANNCHSNDLKKTGFKFFDGFALSNSSSKSVKFYTGGNRTGDSYYKEMTQYYDDNHIDIPCKTLDAVIEESDIPKPDFIKIDTQGSELDILSGASFLNKVNMIYCECPITKYNHGAPTILEYLEFFKSHRFVPLSVFECHHMDNILVHIDILFINNIMKEKYFGKNNINPFL